MKPAFITLAAALFAASVSAGDKFDMHQGLSTPDLSPPPEPAGAVSGSAVSGGFDMHHGLESPDLSPPPVKEVAPSTGSGGVDFHQGLHTPDLSPPPYKK